MLYVSSHCQYCEKSVPFYRELLRLASQPELSFQVVVATKESAAVAKEYAETKGLADASIISGVKPDIKLPVTPIVVIVNNQTHAVVKSWMGFLDAEKQSEVLRVLKSTAKRVTS